MMWLVHNVRTVKALGRLRGCADLPGPSLLHRVQARGRLRRNTRPDGVNFALEGSGGEKTSPDICSFCKKSLLVLPAI